jgi:16S rRNA (guanine966-N2)-methyltransferase
MASRASSAENIASRTRSLVDRAVKTAKANAALVLRQAPAGLVIETSGSPVQSFLDSARSFWDLVFLDPPYDLGLPELQRNLEALVPRLSPGATVVLERSSRTLPPELPEGLELERRKDYGDTALYWLSPNA